MEERSRNLRASKRLEPIGKFVRNCLLVETVCRQPYRTLDKLQWMNGKKIRVFLNSTNRYARRKLNLTTSGLTSAGALTNLAI